MKYLRNFHSYLTCHLVGKLRLKNQIRKHNMDLLQLRARLPVSQSKISCVAAQKTACFDLSAYLALTERKQFSAMPFKTSCQPTAVGAAHCGNKD